MRSVTSILIAFGVLVAFTSVEAIFRPGYGGGRRPPSSYHGGHGDDDCQTNPPQTPKPTTVATTLTTTIAEKKCPAGFTKFERVPAANNKFTAEWCMKAVYKQEAILINDADALCQTVGAELTTLGSEVERTFFGDELAATLATYGRTSGAIAVDGRRKANCVSRDRAVLDTVECNGLNAFNLMQGNTAPDFPWTHWALNEPSTDAWTYDIEQCVQFAVDPYNANRTRLLNDIYCNMQVAPNDPTNSVYWNFGAICGVLPQ